MGQGNKNLKRTWMRNNSNKNLTKLDKKINKLKKPGKTYTKAQLMALKRKAEGKTISQVKSENKESMKKKAAARHATFKAAQRANSALKINNKKNKEKKNKKTNTIGYSEKYPKLLNLK